MGLEEEEALGTAEGTQAVVRKPGLTAANEWTAASLAHASVLLTLILGVAGGIGVLVGPAVALAIYFGYRERSRFVAFHALQSFVYQVGGVLIYIISVAVLVVWVAMAWAISGLLSAALVGLLLIPLALLLTMLVVAILVGAPLGWLGYGVYAAYEVYQGRDYHYWLIGQWLKERE